MGSALGQPQTYLGYYWHGSWDLAEIRSFGLYGNGVDCGVQLLAADCVCIFGLRGFCPRPPSGFAPGNRCGTSNPQILCACQPYLQIFAVILISEMCGAIRLRQSGCDFFGGCVKKNMKA